MNYPILSKINSPDDVKKLNIGEIDSLCKEIRDCIITTVSKNGGHLASNLGVVELTVALHRAFNSPEDAIIFDVGHQCYTHKLLTGRFNKFSTIRTEGGISGFLRPEESEHDSFITGHSSNSVSAAFGIYKAKRMLGEKGTAIAVIGDGALTGGMAYEALNNAGSCKGNFIVVLNDNKMSISHNVGSLSSALTKMRNKPRYHYFKLAINKILLKIPYIGTALNRFVFKIKEIIKGVFYRSNVFSSLGFNYLGPVDGHNVEAMESLFDIAKNYNRPSLIHVITQKGKGYSFAESNPNSYHGVSSFDIKTGANIYPKKSFSSVAGNTLCKLAEKDSKICAITAAMCEGTGLTEFSTRFKDRFFDVGIAEQHAVTFAAGLAKQGLKPFFAVYSTFLQRGFDQIIHDCAIGNFPVKFLIDRAGIVGEDGETHQGIFDVSYLTLIPNITVYSPSTYSELEYRINESADSNNIVAIRYPRGIEQECESFDITADFSILKGKNEKVVITYGRLFCEACRAKEINKDLTVIKLNKIYPISEALIQEISEYKAVHIFEESVKNGGIGEHLSASLLSHGYSGDFFVHTVENKFLPAVNTVNALKNIGLDSETMINC